MLIVFNSFGNLLPNTKQYPATKVVDDLTDVLDSISSRLVVDFIKRIYLVYLTLCSTKAPIKY